MGNTIHLEMADGHKMPCYHALPDGERRGWLVLVQEIFGVTDHIRELCDEYAADGYEVISPGLFDRQEPGCALGYSGADWERAVVIARQEHDWDQGIDDTAQVIAWMKERDGPVFITGYCFGGSVAWRMAQLMEFIASLSEHDLIAPVRGTRHLRDYFAERMARGPARP